MSIYSGITEKSLNSRIRMNNGVGTEQVLPALLLKRTEANLFFSFFFLFFFFFLSSFFYLLSCFVCVRSLACLSYPSERTFSQLNADNFTILAESHLLSSTQVLKYSYNE